jgi:hypothetical protein
LCVLFFFFSQKKKKKKKKDVRSTIVSKKCRFKKQLNLSQNLVFLKKVKLESSIEIQNWSFLLIQK